MLLACAQGPRFARARRTGIFGPSFRVGLAGSCLRQVSSQAAMAPPSDISWEALAQTIRDKHPDIVTAQENTAEDTLDYRFKRHRCPYCHKVWMMLEEKKIPYTVEKINMRCYGDKPDSFLAKVPRGLLPVLELDGQVITESSQIMNVLEKEFPENPMLPPAGTPEAKRAQQLMQLERQLFGEWMGWLTSGGWGHDQNRAKFNRVLRLCDDQLQASKGSFFMGEQLTLVDLAFVPFVERMVSSLLYYKGFAIRGTGMFPGIDSWFEALEKRPSYLAARSDHYTHCHDLPPQLGGCQMHKDGEDFAKQINGRDGKNWHLPLAPLTATSQPECYSPGDNPPADRALAAFRLVNNHAAVAKFAARGAGEEGPVPVWAPLSDPSAIPNEKVEPYVEKSLSVVAQALMEGTESEAVLSNLASLQAGLEPASLTKDVCLSLQYLRDRVGVPRDLPLPAARQLRAHLNWCIDKLST